MEQYVELAPNKPENIVEMCKEFTHTMDDELIDNIIKAYQDWTTWQHETELAAFASRRQLDFEKWWYIPRPLVGEW